MSNELTKLLDEIQAKPPHLTLEEIAKKIGYSRPYLNKAKGSGGNKKLISILKEEFAEILKKEDKGIAIETSKESMAKEIGHLKAVVKVQSELLVRMAAEFYGRPVQDVAKELIDKTTLIMMDQREQ